MPALTGFFLRSVRPVVSRSAPGGLPRLYSSSSSSSSVETVPLAFTRHDPPAELRIPRHESPPPLVVMHGLFGSRQNNRSISKALARDLNTPVYALDLRNHGDSPHVQRHDYESMAADVEAFLREHRLGPNAVLIGHSMGAKTAMAVALRQPSLISKIIAVDNAPVETILSPAFGNYVRAMRHIEESKVKRQSEADKILEEVEENLGVRQFLLTNLTRPKGEEFLKFRVPVRILQGALDRMGSFPYHPDKVRFEKPALFVRGMRSHYVPDETIPLIGRFFPLFSLKDIDAGHWVISEKPNDFKEVVCEWLGSKD